MTPWIQNVSLIAVKKGEHNVTGDNTILIQIVDPMTEFPVPAQKFQEVFQFEFLDVEDDGKTNFGDGHLVDMSEFAITDDQAVALVKILQNAKEKNQNVVVHCHAGICRSGAVCEVGIMMGFADTKVFRSPNLLVKHKMMKTLGWTYDSDEPHSVNGIVLPEDWTNDNEKVFILAQARKQFREHEGDI